MPELDQVGRPKLFYGELIHENCPRYQWFEKEKYAQVPGDEGCLVFLGCKGPVAQSDCHKRHWNNGVNWCIGSGAPCIGCTQPEFPDGVSPFYGKLSDEKLGKRLDPPDVSIARGVVPYVVGLTEYEAFRRLEQAGLGVDGAVGYLGHTDLPNYARTQVKIGCVLSTMPTAGSWVGEGGKVAIAIRQN
jgi:hydrogenase small subunit